MSQADELLNSLDDIAVASVDPETEPHIIIDNNRNITVPDELRRIAVQYDHNVETVTFDCPRYWDGHDLSVMTIYINYMRSDGGKGFFIAENVTVDESDTDIMHFTWTITKNVTMYKGSVSFLVCITSVDEDGDEEVHWNSELCNQISVSEGLECHEAIEESYPDIYTQLVDLVKENTFSEEYRNMIYENTSNIGIHENEISVLNNNVSSLQTGLSATVTRVNELEETVESMANTGVDLSDYYNKSEVDDKISELESRADANDTVVGNLSNALNNAVFESDIDTELSTSSTNPVQNKAVSLRMEAHGSQLTQLQGKVEKNITDISDLQSTVQTNVDNIGIHENEISVLNNNVSSLQTGLSATVTRVNELESRADANDTTVNGVIGDISTLSERVTANETSISSLQEEMNDFDADVFADMQETVNNANDVVNDCEDRMAEIEQRLEAMTSLGAFTITEDNKLQMTLRKGVILSGSGYYITASSSCCTNVLSTDTFADGVLTFHIPDGYTVTANYTNSTSGNPYSMITSSTLTDGVFTPLNYGYVNFNFTKTDGTAMTAEETHACYTWNDPTIIEGITNEPELLDIRVGADGVTYDTAGQAVRTQFKNIKEDIKSVSGGVTEKLTLIVGSGINSSGTIFSNTSGQYIRTDIMDIENENLRRIEFFPHGDYNIICNFFDSANSFIAREFVTPGYKLPEDYEHVAFSFYKPAGGITEDLVHSLYKWDMSANASILETKKLNLFDGNYTTGIKLGGSTTITIQADSSFKSVALIPVKPNTKYTLLMEDPGLESGYYYYKVLELANASYTTNTFKGASNTVVYTNTTSYRRRLVITTTSTASHLVIQTSKAIQPFLQVFEGEIDDFTVDEYNDTTVTVPNDTLHVYSKDEVDVLTAKRVNTFSKSGNNIIIKMDKAMYYFNRITNTSINVDTWRLYAGYLNRGDKYNNTWFIMWSDSDAEGAIKISGEDDFVCGYHGDEIMTDIKIFVDGVELDLSIDHETTEFKELHIYVTSDVYHCNTSTLASTKAFKRNKMLIFKGDTVKIGNHFKCLSDLVIERAALSLFQCYYKTSSGSTVLSNYSVNTDYKIYSLDDTTAYPSSSSDMTEAWLSTQHGNINFKSLKTSGQKYVGMVGIGFVSSQNRLKIYFDTINANTNVNAGDIIGSEFEFTIS